MKTIYRVIPVILFLSGCATYNKHKSENSRKIASQESLLQVSPGFFRSGVPLKNIVHSMSEEAEHTKVNLQDGESMIEYEYVPGDKEYVFFNPEVRLIEKRNGRLYLTPFLKLNADSAIREIICQKKGFTKTDFIPDYAYPQDGVLVFTSFDNRHKYRSAIKSLNRGFFAQMYKKATGSYMITKDIEKTDFDNIEVTVYRHGVHILRFACFN